MDVPTSFPFFLGLGVIILYAWGRFDEPSFPKEETLPSAVVPLRYLFLRPAYSRARLTYVGISMAVYFVLVLSGKPILDALGIRAENFPAEAWPLSVALLMVGVLPNPNMKLINQVEERLRRGVHAFFLVPDGVKETIAIMEDAAYKPPADQLAAVSQPMRGRIEKGLAEQRGSLRYRWARAAMLMEAIDQMGNGSQNPLVRAHFESFQDDLRTIRQSYKALRLEMEAIETGKLSDDAETALREGVDRLLRRLYAFISWGVRHYARSDRAVVDTLGQCGFVVPAVDHGRRLFDIVFPAFLAVVTLVFLYCWGESAASGDASIRDALSSALAAGLMYGASAWVALQYRGRMIEDSSWHSGSARCLASIGLRAGLITWAVIVLSTVLFNLGDAIGSVSQLGVETVAMTSLSASALWLPIKIGTAAPWVLAGATFSVLLALRFDGDLQRLEWRDRGADALIVGTGLAVAVLLASVIQQGLTDNSLPPVQDLFTLFLVALLIGGAMGFTVPAAFRRDIIRPSRAQARHALRDLLDIAARKFGGAVEARRWAFTPPEDDTTIPVTPAEALRYRNYATSVWALLNESAPPLPAAAPTLEVLEGGRLAG